MTARLPAPAPAVDPAARPFWEATARHVLLLPHCAGCAQVFWPPRSWCPACGSRRLHWRPAAGTGHVYSFTVVRRGAGEYRNVNAYVLAYVELDEGPRILTNVVDADARTLRIGLPVTVVFQDTGEGSALPRFRPAAVPEHPAPGGGRGADQSPSGGAAPGGRR